MLAKLNDYGRDNGIGRLDLVENRFVGMKSRGVYETPGGTILLTAHRAIESITLDRGAAHLKDDLMPRYAELIYYGFWFSPEREMLQAMIDKSQDDVGERPEEPARQVDQVDALVQQLAAARDRRVGAPLAVVADPAAVAVARADVQQLADRAGVDQRAGLLEGRVEAVVEPDPHEPPVARRPPRAAASSAALRRGRLLDQDVLAGLDGRQPRPAPARRSSSRR